MERPMHYNTISEAIEKLRSKGFNLDFNMEANVLSTTTEKFPPENLEIVDVYRYEGNSDPGDEASVYALESTSGARGILVTGYGVSSDSKTEGLLKKIKRRKN
jgi:hypothetical protein